MARKANGEGSIRKKTIEIDGKVYTAWEGRISIGRDPGTGKQIRKSVSGKTQKEVIAKMKEIKRKLDNRTYTDIPRITVSEWLDMWLQDYAAPSLKNLTLDTYRSRIDTHIKPAIGATKLCNLTVPLLQHFCNSLTTEKKLAPKTVINIMAILQKAVAQAVDLDYLPNNLVERVKRPRMVQKEIKPLTENEISDLLSKLSDGDVASDMIMLTLFTGMREGEVCGLPWSAVDFKNSTITVRQQLQKRKTKGSAYEITTCKEEKTRCITAAPSIMSMLEERKKIQQKQKRDAGMFWHNDWNLVFTQADGKYVPSQTFLKKFKRIAEQIGRPDAYVHTLRHTYAVMSLQEGDDVKTVQENLGHATAAFTLDVYGHVSEKMKKESADRTEKFIKKMRA